MSRPNLEGSLAGKEPLPPGWRWARLYEICIQERKIVDANTDATRKIPYIGLENIESISGKIKKQNVDFFETVGMSTTFAFDRGHVLYGKLRPYLNKVGLPDSPGRCTTEIIPLKPKDGINRGYLAWLLRREETVHEAMRGRTGSRMPRADMNELLKIVVPVAPVHEQECIAGILNERMAAIDKARAAAEAQLEAAEALSESYLRQVFPKEGQSLPPGWRWAKMSEVCEIQLGKMLSPKSKLGIGSFPYLRNANIQWNQIEIGDVAQMDFTIREQNKFRLKKDDLLICEGGEPGRCAVWDGRIDPCFYQKSLHRLRPVSNAINPSFLMFRMWFGVLRSEFLGANAKTTIAHLPAVRLKLIMVPLPDLLSQERIVKKLTDWMSSAVSLQAEIQKRINEINALPQALLRQAFNGEL